MKQKDYSGILRYLLVGFVILAIGIALGYYQITPTRAPKDNQVEMITLEAIEGEAANYSMVMSHLYEMAKAPHPSGSDEIDKVRNYILTQFDKIGCEYQVQDFTVDMTDTIREKVAAYQNHIKGDPEEQKFLEEYYASLGFASYEEWYRADIQCTDTNILNCVNYIVKIDAPDTDNGVMFVSHYDSTSYGPGAGDDLISVASMLEALRDVKSKGNLSNDMYFLFTDAEELDLYGAAAFVPEYPEMKDSIDLVINLEARGNNGPLLMFQTSDHNKQIVKEVSKALDQISMYSSTAAFYKTMPNDTDLTEFLDAGYTGINFAVIGGSEHYHQMTDNYENLNRNTAYMYYKTTMDLADYFSNSDLKNLSSSEDAVYFPFFKGNTVIISNLAMFIFSCLVGIASFIWIILLLLQKETKIKECAGTFVSLLFILVGAALGGFLGGMLYNKIRGSGSLADLIGRLNILFYIICFFIILDSLIHVFQAAKKASSKQTLILSGLLVFNLLNWVCTFLLNSLAYLFTVPLLLLLLYSILLYTVKDSKKKKYISYGYLLLQGIIVLMLYTPIVYMMYSALSSSFLYVNTILVGLAVQPIAIICASVLNISKPIESEKL